MSETDLNPPDDIQAKVNAVLEGLQNEGLEADHTQNETAYSDRGLTAFGDPKDVANAEEDYHNQARSWQPDIKIDPTNEQKKVIEIPTQSATSEVDSSEK
jgi:hypothetical protein